MPFYRIYLRFLCCQILLEALLISCESKSEFQINAQGSAFKEFLKF